LRELALFPNVISVDDENSKRPADEEKKSGQEQKDEFNCPGRHGVTSFPTPSDGWYCNRCFALDGVRDCHPEGTTFYGCRTCDYDFCPACKDELDAGQLGDLIIVNEQDYEENSWIQGSNLDGSKSGVFPTNYTERVTGIE